MAPKRILASLACGAFLLSAPHAPLHARLAAADAPPALESALARQRDAESLARLSTDGQLLYGREKVKLTGYQYCSQSVSLAEQGEFRRSIRAASKALHLGQRARDADLLGASMRDLAIAYNYAGALDRAEEYARRAIGQGAKNASLVVAPSSKVLGDVALRRGQTAKALDAYRAALEAASERYRPVVEVSLANAWVAAGDLAAARAAYERIEPPSNPAFRQTYLRGLGQLLLADGRPADALRVFGEALAAAQGTDAAYYRLWAHDGRARAYLAMDDPAKAAAEYAGAVSAADAMRARFRSEEFKTALFGDVQQVFERAMLLAMRTGDPARAFDISEKSRSRALLDLIRERSATTAATRDERPGATLDSAQVRAALRPGEAIVQYHTLDDALLAWVLRSERIDGFMIDLARPLLAERVMRFRDDLIARRPVAGEAQALHDLLIAPLRLRPGERLVFVPHGPLHYLPFQALREGDAWLIERHPVALAPSSTLAVEAMTRGDRVQGSLVAFGNPATEEQYALPGSEREVQQIGALFPHSRVFVRADASRSRFTQRAGTGSILHVAAHAETDEIDPPFSRILLAREGDDPGFLEAREIRGLDLSGVSLVALSACESGLGRSPRGDEVLGFTRAFLGAGASSLVSSLWPVDDDSTAFLMSQLYGEMARGVDLQSAMQRAQIASMKRPRFGHPFFWAPFVALGDWRQTFVP